MKKNNLFLYFSFILLFFLFSCNKKYDYHFPAGYDDLMGNTPSDLDTSDYSADKSLYDKARIFPGLVEETERRIQDTGVNIDLTKKYISPVTLKILAAPMPIASTGLYAAPGEMVRVTVPPGVNGLSVQIGIQMDDLSGVASSRRDPIIYTVKQLFPGNNYIKNLYGGYIWIRSDFSLNNQVQLRFKNVERAPDYIDGISNLATWKNEVKKSGVPWLEIRSSHVIFSLPRNLVLDGIDNNSYSDLSYSLDFWNNLVSDQIYKLFGFVKGSSDIYNQSPEYPERLVLDVQPKDSMIHGGQPIVAQTNNFWIKQWFSKTFISSFNIRETFNKIFDNYAPVNSFWGSDYPKSVVQTLFLYKIAKDNDLPFTAAPNESFQDTLMKAIDTASTDITSIGRNFAKDTGFLNVYSKLAPLLQIFGQVQNPETHENGWAFLPYLYLRSRQMRVGESDLDRMDFIYTSLASFTHKDFYPFFKAWGIPVSTAAQSQVMHSYPQITTAMWKYNPFTESGGDQQISKRIYMDRLLWSVDVNSEALNEGAKNTKEALLDGDPNTYWHSCWSGCSPSNHPVPHYINIDMQEVHTVSGFYVASRIGQRRVRTVVLSVSEDGENWQEAIDTFHMENRDNDQYFNLKKPLKFRYFEFKLPEPGYDSDVNSPLNALAEIGAYYDEK